MEEVDTEHKRSSRRNSRTTQMEDVNTEHKETTECIFDFGDPDFETIVKTSAFVDKTLLIEEVFKGTSRVIVTAPRRFGKSTNMNMVKRFVEIDVDNEGKTKDDKTTTSSYKLFKDNNLEIFRREQLFNEHFGKYPVMYIDFKPLRKVGDYDIMIEEFGRIVVETFSWHTYLLRVEGLWTDDLHNNDLKKYCMERLVKGLNASELRYSFKYLSKLLYRHFGEKVFVLIDDYDAFINSVMYEHNTNPERIISFFEATYDNLFLSNRYVGRALLTGVLSVTGAGLPFHGDNIIDYYFLNDHPFSKYYGLTSDELDSVLAKLIKYVKERIQRRSTIDEYYNGYTVRNQNIRLYSFWSVLRYLSYREAQSHWCMPAYSQGFESLFKVQEISAKVKELLLGDTAQADVSKPLSRSDVLQLYNAIRSKKIKPSAESTTVDAFILLLYHLGYLSISKDLGKGNVYLKIPNEEIKYELEMLVSRNASTVL